MRTSIKGFTAIVLAATTLSACITRRVVQEPVVTTPVVVAPVAPACYDVSALRRVETAAETKTVTAVSLIENPPYAPIEQSTSTQIVTKQAQIYYVLDDPQTGRATQVTNLCNSTIPQGPVGPAPGEILGASTSG